MPSPKTNELSWVWPFGSLEVIRVDRHGRQYGKAYQVKSISEAIAICTGQIKPKRQRGFQ